MNRNAMNRRQFLKFSALAGGAAMIAACAPPPGAEQAAQTAQEAQQPAAPAAESGAVQYWVGWGNLQQSWDAIVQTDEYKEWMGDIEVEL
jgi:hypothetical protein